MQVMIHLDHAVLLNEIYTETELNQLGCAICREIYTQNLITASIITDKRRLWMKLVIKPKRRGKNDVHIFHQYTFLNFQLEKLNFSS